MRSITATQEEISEARRKAKAEEDRRRAEFHVKLEAACQEGFEAGARGINMCPHYHGSPLRVVWDTCWKIGADRVAIMRDKPEGRLEAVEEAVKEVLGHVGGLKEALKNYGTQAATEAQP